VRKLLAEIWPVVRQKYGLSDELLNLASYSGVAIVAVEYAKSIEGMEPFKLSDVLAVPAAAQSLERYFSAQAVQKTSPTPTLPTQKRLHHRRLPPRRLSPDARRNRLESRAAGHQFADD
jgi:hypothetical protein